MKATRAEVLEIISACFNILKQSLNEIPAQNIFNYNETNVTDNPGIKTVFVRRDQN